MRLDNGDIEEFNHEDEDFPKIKSVIGSSFCESEDDFKNVLLKFIGSDANRVELKNAKLYLDEGVFQWKMILYKLFFYISNKEQIFGLSFDH